MYTELASRDLDISRTLSSEDPHRTRTRGGDHVLARKGEKLFAFIPFIVLTHFSLFSLHFYRSLLA